MTEQTEQVTTQTGAVPARVELEDFIEAVTRGVARALQAQDEVGGYVMSRPAQPGAGTITIGIVAPDFRTISALAGTPPSAGTGKSN